MKLSPSSEIITVYFFARGYSFIWFRRGMMSISHRGKPLVSFVSASSLSSNNAAFTPIATKEFEYRRFWWSGALRNLIVERQWGELIRLHFSRGVVGRVHLKLHSPSFIIISPRRLHHSRRSSPSLVRLPPRFALTSQRNITAISIPADIASR